MGSHTSHDAEVSRDVLDSLRRIVQNLRESSRRVEQRLGISGAQLFVLEKLAESPAQSLNDLAARTFTHQSSVSTVVARLVDEGLVSRQQSGSDARQMELGLTVRGRRLATQTTGTAQQQLVEAVSRLPIESRRQLATLLSQVVAGMAGPAEAPRMFFDADRKPSPAASHANRTPRKAQR